MISQTLHKKRKKLGLAFLRKGVEGIFHESQIQVLRNEIADTTSIDSEPSQEELDAKRKDAEIKNMRKRHKMYDSTCEALYDWYTRHHSGCGFLDEKEFASVWRAVVGSYGLNLDDAQVRRHWHEMSTLTECSSGFTQFVNYLVHRFPHVKTMTAYQVRRFQERSKSIRQEPEPVQEENAEAKERRREEEKEEKEEDEEEGDESEAEEDEEEVESKSMTTEDSSSRRPKLAQHQNSGSSEKTRPQRPKLAQHQNSVSLGKMRLQRPKLAQHHNSISVEKTRRLRKAGEPQEL